MRLVRDIGYFLLFCLMVLGVGGVMYHAMGKNGWIDRVLGGLFHHGLGSALAVVVGGALLIWLTRRWLVSKRSQSVFNDVLMYGVVALGLLFAGRLIIYGSL